MAKIGEKPWKNHCFNLVFWRYLKRRLKPRKRGIF